jgi:hypothetical protein
VLELDLDPGVPTILDGAWYPPTRDAATELTDLIAAFDDRGTRINLVMLNPTGWHNRPSRAEHGDSPVRVAWFDALDAGVLIATTERTRRIQLLIVTDEVASLSASGI